MIVVFVLGLMLAYFFAVVLKDTPFALPASGRLSSGIRVETMAQVWGLKQLSGPIRGLLDFLSGIYIPTALITGQWGAAGDAFRHLLLPALALSTIPMAIIARITRSSLLDVLGRDYVMPLFTDPMGLVMLGGASLLLLVGVFWMSKLIKVEV